MSSKANAPIVSLTAEERLTGTVKCPQCSRMVLLTEHWERADLAEISAHMTAESFVSARLAGLDVIPTFANTYAQSATWCFGSYTVVHLNNKENT